MRKQIVILLASLAILPGASGSSESHLRGVSAEADKPVDVVSKVDHARSFIGTNLQAIPYPSVDKVILMASQPSIIKQIRSPTAQQLLKEANLPRDILEMLQNVYFPKDISGEPTPQLVRAAFSNNKYRDLLKDPELKALFDNPRVAKTFMQHFYPKVNAEDIIAMGSKPEVIRYVREKNLFHHMEHYGLSHELSKVLTKVYFPKDGKVPSSEEVKAALSRPLAKSVLESSEFQTVFRSEDVTEPMPWFFKPVASTTEFIKMYSHPKVVNVVKSDTFKTLLREAGMPEKMLNTFLAIYHPKAGEMEGKSLSDYVKEQLSSRFFSHILGDSDFRSAIFSAQVADVVLPHYPLA